MAPNQQASLAFRFIRMEKLGKLQPDDLQLAPVEYR